jgi:hypothetical protein
MFQKNRFEVIKKERVDSFAVWILLDKETGIEYLAAGTPTPHAITPLLNKDEKKIE